jgi:hypothetical protein
LAGIGIIVDHKPSAEPAPNARARLLEHVYDMCMTVVRGRCVDLDQQNSRLSRTAGALLACVA